MKYAYYLYLVSIGSYIRIAREKAGLQQNQLAEMIGIENNYLSELERGVSCPSFPLMVALSDKLNVSMQFLTRGTDEVSPEVAFPKETLYYIPEAAGFNERRYKRLLKLFRNMTEAIKDDHEDG